MLRIHVGLLGLVFLTPAAAEEQPIVGVQGILQQYAITLPDLPIGQQLMLDGTAPGASYSEAPQLGRQLLFNETTLTPSIAMTTESGEQLQCPCIPISEDIVYCPSCGPLGPLDIGDHPVFVDLQGWGPNGIQSFDDLGDSTFDLSSNPQFEVLRVIPREE